MLILTIKTLLNGKKEKFPIPACSFGGYHVFIDH